MSVKDKFKASKLSDVQEQIDKGNQFLSQNGNNSNGFVDKIETRRFDDGRHKFRIWSPHEDTKGYAIPFVTVWLPAYVYERDKQGKPKQDKEGNYVTKKSKKPIFNARVHGNTDKDIVEEYIRIAEEQIQNNETDDDVINEKIDNLHHFQNGLSYKPDYVMYASEVKKGEKSEPFVLQVTNAQMNQLNKIAAMQDEDDEEIVTDPFTDPEIGRCLVLEKDSQAKDNRDRYIFNIDTAIDKQTQKIKLYPLSEEELEKYDKLLSLEQRFGSNVYTQRDFEFALEGVKMYDEDNEIGAVQTQEFQELVTELQDQYPEKRSFDKKDDGRKEESENKEVEKEQESNEKFVSATQNTDESDDEYEEEEGDEEEEESGDQLDNMDRAELKAFIKKNGYSIKVQRKWSDDTIRDKIREEQEEDDLPWKDTNPDEGDVEKSKDEVEEGQVEQEKSNNEQEGGSIKDRLQKFKQKSNQKNE